MSMPPFPLWYQGHEAIGAALRGMVLVEGARGRFRALATRANGQPAVAVYERSEAGTFRPSALHVLRLTGAGIAEIVAFLDPNVLHGFSVPATLPPRS